MTVADEMCHGDGGGLDTTKPELTITVEPWGDGTRWTQAVEFEALPGSAPSGGCWSDWSSTGRWTADWRGRWPLTGNS